MFNFNLGKNGQKGQANSSQYRYQKDRKSANFFPENEDEGEPVHLVKFSKTKICVLNACSIIFVYCEYSNI